MYCYTTIVYKKYNNKTFKSYNIMQSKVSEKYFLRYCYDEIKLFYSDFKSRLFKVLIIISCIKYIIK